MFTGIVQGQATLVSKTGTSNLSHFCFRFPQGSLDQISEGASIAINGTCLTVTGFDLNESTANFDAIAETLRLTNLGSLSPGDNVNYERAAKIGDEIGGHLMSGHIHSSPSITNIENTTENSTFFINIHEEIRPYILSKGFVGLNGCSLTIGEVTKEYFTVHLIPETLKITTFSTLREGDRVNLELDSQTQTIVDTVSRLLSAQTDISRYSN
jgi:riboflavin synthase